MPLTDRTIARIEGECQVDATNIIDALEEIDLKTVQSNGYSFQIELTHRIWRCGMKIAEVPIIFTDRFQGTSKMSTKIIREALWMVWRLWLQNGLRRSPRKKS